jgi:FMN phosphatase YigB (HAD superfamily)
VQRATSPTLSFDVFDTTVTRIWFRPSDLFLAAGQRLVQAGHFDGSPERWAELRVEVEQQLRRTMRDSEEIGLDGIYDRLAERLDWPDQRRDQAMQIELAAERAAIRPIGTTHAALNAALSSRSPVIFLSDTYFEQSFVVELLRQSGVVVPPETVYTSLARGRTKRTGTLFTDVLADRGLPPGDLHHTGDNVATDIAAAKRLGVHATLFEAQRPTRYEQQLYAPQPSWPRLLCAGAAGAARAARLAGSESDARLRTVYETGANVAAPLLTGYVLWVLTEAHRRGLPRLYFLSRDGQVLQAIAARLNAWLGWNIDLRYLYASRQALFLPAVTSLDDTARAWLFEDAPESTLRAIFARADLTPESHAQWLQSVGFGESAWEAPLGESGGARLRALSHESYFTAAVEASAAARRKLLLGYLHQEGCLDGSPFALVDIGWRGRLQRCLARVMRSLPERSVPAPIGFYFGLAEKPEASSAGELVSFSSGLLPNAALLETFVKADHGSVLGFVQQAAGVIEPELRAAFDQEGIEWGVRLQQAGILAFVDTLLAALAPADTDTDLLMRYLGQRGREVFDSFSQFPTPAEGAAYGSLTHAADQTHSHAVATAPRLDSSTLLHLMLRSHHAVEDQTIWPEGSIARSLRRSWSRRLLQGAWKTRRSVAAALRAKRAH